jgi:D-glycero-D-manno-heptose 1,7-bisphosphate phosphatase
MEHSSINIKAQIVFDSGAQASPEFVGVIKEYLRRDGIEVVAESEALALSEWVLRICVGPKGFFATDYARIVRYSLNHGGKFLNVVDVFKDKKNHNDGFYDTRVFLSTVLGVAQGMPHGVMDFPSGGRWFLDAGELRAYALEPRKPCLFLDRDGIVVKNVDYMYQKKDVEIIPEVAELIARANKAGWYVVVVSNQSGVGRGYFSDADCEAINNYIGEQVTALTGGVINYWLYCPYHPTDAKGPYCRESVYRKPKPGMVLEACSLLPIDIDKSLMVGDNVTDVLEMPGLKCVLVNTGRDLSTTPSGVQVLSGYGEALECIRLKGLL